MADEFDESDILFRENVEAEDSSIYNHGGGGGDFPARINKNIKSSQQRKLSSSSVPIIIPEINNYVSRSAWFGRSDFGGDEGEFVPPHVIIGRRVAGKVMAFSVCSGNGGTLKGRHLSEFRNSILRMTGFLET